MTLARLTLAAALAAGVCAPAAAQTIALPNVDAYLHSVPRGEASQTPIALSLADAVTRGLDQNLAVLTGDDRVESASGARWKALSELLPHASGRVTETREKFNPAAFGLSGFPGVPFPPVIGPFNVFDARLAASMPIVDLQALADVHRDQANVRAEEHSLKDARALVVLAVSATYWGVLTDESRLTALQAQADTAAALLKLAQDQQASGVVAGIDVLRQQVQLETARQRVIVAQNDVDKQRLRLARAIGLPVGQAFTLTTPMHYTPAPAVTTDAALALAYKQREDLLSAEERLNAAKADQAAARGTRLPSLHLDADYGSIGERPETALMTFTVVTTLRVPIFQGGDTRGRVLQADATTRERQADVDDLKAGIAFDVQSALLDLHAADAAMSVATNAKTLADQQLAQARDRFAAGVGTSVELAQAQDALAAASDNYLGTLFAQVLAKGALARALGVPEQQLVSYLGGIE